MGVTHRGKIHSTSNVLAYQTDAAYTPAANVLLMAFVVGRTDNTLPTSVTGHGVTYSLKASVNDPGNGGVMGLYVADSGASPTSVAVEATWSTNRSGCSIQEFDESNADLSGGAAAAIVQAPTGSGTAASGSITLAAAGNSNNRPISCWHHKAQEVVTERTNWTELDDGGFATPSCQTEYQWRSDAFETTASASWTSNVEWFGVAAEIKAAGGAAFADPQRATHILKDRLQIPNYGPLRF